MKITVYLKDPDVFDEAIHDAVEASLEATGLPEDERDAIRQVRYEKAGAFLRKWVEHGEYVRLVFDTEAGTATVVPR